MQQSAAFSESDLSETLRKNGLSPLKTGTFFLKPWSHSKMAQMQESGTISENELEWLYNVSGDVGGFGAEVYSVAEKS